MQYVHLKGDGDLVYSTEEITFEYNERMLLCLLSELRDDYFMLGYSRETVKVSGSETRTAYVKGYVVRWRCGKDEKGFDVSELELIGSAEQQAIKQLVQSKCKVEFVFFEQEENGSAQVWREEVLR